MRQVSVRPVQIYSDVVWQSGSNCRMAWVAWLHRWIVQSSTNLGIAEVSLSSVQCRGIFVDTPNSSHRIRRDPLVGQLIVKLTLFFYWEKNAPNWWKREHEWHCRILAKLWIRSLHRLAIGLACFASVAAMDLLVLQKLGWKGATIVEESSLFTLMDWM